MYVQYGTWIISRHLLNSSKQCSKNGIDNQKYKTDSDEVEFKELRDYLQESRDLKADNIGCRFHYVSSVYRLCVRFIGYVSAFQMVNGRRRT